jgi:hypothetical protein
MFCSPIEQRDAQFIRLTGIEIFESQLEFGHTAEENKLSIDKFVYEDYTLMLLFRLA